MIESAPTNPTPIPLDMDAIISNRMAEATTCEMFVMVGRAAMHEMAALALYVEHPFENANRLYHRISEFASDKRCATLVLSNSRGRMLTSECLKGEKPRREPAARLLQALIGAHFLEGGAIAVSRLWTWLTGQAQLGLALQYMPVSIAFKGRTDSYKERWELTGKQLKQHPRFVNPFGHTDTPIDNDTAFCFIVDEDENYNSI